MAVRNHETEDYNILSIGGPGTDDWEFKLGSYITTINMDYPCRDIYIIGYRDEERPNLFDAHKRTSVPFFAVHTLKMGSPAPDTLVVTDGLTRKEDRQSMSKSSFKWVHLHSFSNGETVHILQFVGRTTKGSMREQRGMTCGGKIFFPKRVKAKRNPGDAFEISLDGEVYYFDYEVWDSMKSGLKKTIRDSCFENWIDCCCRAKKQEILSIAVPCALDAFFSVYDDLDRSAHEDVVRKGLSEMFWQFKKDVSASEKLFEKMQLNGSTADQAMHFKIYPSNQVLLNYIKAGNNSYISEWTGKAMAVFPCTEETATSDEPLQMGLQLAAS